MMYRIKFFLLCSFLFFLVVNLSAEEKGLKRDNKFDQGWLFKAGDIENAEAADFNDKDWRKLNLPHDWSIEDLPNQSADSIVGPFSKAAISQRDGGFTIGGTAWYRKHFVLSKEAKNKKVTIQFDGVYMDADVWVNGHHVGNHVYGYTSFYFDITPYLNTVGKSNVIAVQVKNEGNNSRWYSGSGIYRNVWLKITNTAHIKNWGVFVTTTEINNTSATVSVETKLEISNIEKVYSVTTTILNSRGEKVGEAQKEIDTKKIGVATLEQDIVVEKPQLWSVHSPELYTAVVSIVNENKTIDKEEVKFGIRTVKFDAEDGFTLNGEKMLLHGGCIHHDNGPLGAVSIKDAEVRKAKILKQNGYNAVRLSHNPFSPLFLDACDSIGLLVINEAFDMWRDEKRPDDYHLHFDKCWKKDIESFVLRDRNHPSIIMWSTGNEIYESIDSDGYATGKALVDLIKQYDSTRAVTIAIPKFILAMSSRKGKKWDDTAPSYNNVDVCGYNYATNKYKKDHKKFPERIMYESEAFPPKVYESWEIAKDLPYAVGMFTWSAMDYLGEAGLGAPRVIHQDSTSNSNLFLEPDWPIFNAYCGEIDLIGDKKVNSYYLDVVWDRSDVEMLVQPNLPKGYKYVDFYYNFPTQYKSWTFPGEEGEHFKVFVHSKAQLIKLELNGKVIAVKPGIPNTITTEFTVPYKPGTLVAKCFNDGVLYTSDTLVTTGKPYAVKLIPEKGIVNLGEELAYVKVQVVDKEGRVVPNVDNLTIKYDIKGEGSLAAVGNGNPADMSSFQQPEKKVFNGRGLIILKANGKKGVITLEAAADGLKPDTVTIKVK